MYTRCPECSTCFRVTDRHLAIAKGKVRCGKCQHVFNAPDHAIDDLPTNQINTGTAPPQPEIKKTIDVAPVKKATPAPPESATAKTNKKTEDIIQPVKKTKPKTPVIKKSIAQPIFDADATMMAAPAAMNKVDIESLKLDTPKNNPNDITVMTKDEVFDDSFDLDAAIDELTQATDEINETKNIVTEVEEENITEVEQDINKKNNHGDVFTTDAYDATNASSVADILSEMEGQLSLDIDEQKIEKEYDINDEFKFLEIDEDEDDIKNASPKVLKNEVQNNIKREHPENEMDEDELFDQIDLSDFQENDVQEDIILEDSEQTNIGRHSDEEGIPFQLRNDIKSLQTTSRPRLHPLISVALVIILFVLSFSQLAYFRAYELVNLMPSSQPLLEAFCEKVNCHYSGPRDTKKIQLTSRDVRLHPKEKKALLISAAMINNAYFAQPYPKIHIRLSDISGNVIAERIFDAKTYMGKLNNPFLLMKPKTPVHINFEVVDPGKDAINFEFTFL